MKIYDNVFFDLDGTLIQSEFGIIKSAQYALSKMGVDVGEDDYSELLRFIGPPLYNSFHDFYEMSDEDAMQAVKYYREYYEVSGLFDAPLYEGIEELADKLHEVGKKLFVVTSKSAVTAKRIIDHYGLDDRISDVIGPEKSEKSPDKKMLIERAITENDIADKASVIMVGDRFYDIVGADEAGVDSIGVLYGYGSREELEEAGATYIAETPEDILKFVL